MSTTVSTTDHEAIRKWAEERGGKPAAVKEIKRGRYAGVLRIDLPGYSDEDGLVEISWDEFFRKFDQNKLKFVYQDKTTEGEVSRFFRLVSF